jgi:hypothetical protein
VSRFIAVVHGWHVHSNGFDVHELQSITLEDANKEACWLNEQRAKAFDRCAYIVIAIDDTEYLPRSLTWRERISGYLKATS